MKGPEGHDKEEETKHRYESAEGLSSPLPNGNGMPFLFFFGLIFVHSPSKDEHA